MAYRRNSFPQPVSRVLGEEQRKTDCNFILSVDHSIATPVITPWSTLAGNKRAEFGFDGPVQCGDKLYSYPPPQIAAGNCDGAPAVHEPVSAARSRGPPCTIAPPVHAWCQQSASQ